MQSFVGGIEILAEEKNWSNQRDITNLTRAEILKVDNIICTFDDSIKWSNSERKAMQYIEDKLVWIMQNNLSKQQSISLGFMSEKLFEKWLWSQRALSEKFFKRLRNLYINGLKEKVQFHTFVFEEQMPLIITPNWDSKTWTYWNSVKKEEINFKSEIVQLAITYNSHLHELNALVHFYVKVQDKDGNWVNV